MAVKQAVRRVEALEAATDGGRKCPECGGNGDDFGPNDSYELTWVDPGGPEDREEWCESCGRQLVIVITWGDGAL